MFTINDFKNNKPENWKSNLEWSNRLSITKIHDFLDIVFKNLVKNRIKIRNNFYSQLDEEIEKIGILINKGLLRHREFVFTLWVASDNLEKIDIKLDNNKFSVTYENSKYERHSHEIFIKNLEITSLEISLSELKRKDLFLLDEQKSNIDDIQFDNLDEKLEIIDKFSLKREEIQEQLKMLSAQINYKRQGEVLDFEKFGKLFSNTLNTPLHVLQFQINGDFAESYLINQIH
jgi:hypothetical protein